MVMETGARIQILEQPAPKALRFRYECEGRSAGSLPGAKSSSDKKTFPKIHIVGYNGRAVVVVSCVTVDPPYRPHPHNLVGKDGCKKGVCTMEIANDDMTCEFSNLGIQCVKKKDIDDSLRVRAEIRVDPFRTGFSHASQPGSIDLNSVRLCFQVFLEGPERGQFKIPIKPVVSDPIYDKKAINDLSIMKLSDSTSPVIGNKEIILLCDKVSKDDVEIRFFEESSDGGIIWEAYGDFQPSDVHKQYAISFRTPQYRDLEISSIAHVSIQLRCPSKDTLSVPLPFSYVPLQTDTELLKRKRLKLSENNGQKISQYFDEHGALLKRSRLSSFPPVPQNSSLIGLQTHPLQITNSSSHQILPTTTIKLERHTSPSPDPSSTIYPYSPVGFSGGGLSQNSPVTNPVNHRVEQSHPDSQFTNTGTYYQNYSINEQTAQTSTPIQTNPNNSNMGEDLENISLPNLSDVNLSLLENHLSENLSTNLILIDPDVQALGMTSAAGR